MTGHKKGRHTAEINDISFKLTMTPRKLLHNIPTNQR